MTRSQLSRFYSFTGLIYDESPEALAELKKTVLLELKASDKDVLNIGHEQWSKNDLLTCFNTPLDTGFDYASFIADYPWVKNLEHLNIVYYDESIRRTDFSDNRFSQFAEQEGKALEQSFSRLLNQYIAGLYVLGKLIVMLDPATRETMFLKKQLETTPFRESIDFNKDSL